MDEVMKDVNYKAIAKDYMNKGFDSIEEKISFKKKQILGYLLKGATKKAAADLAGIDESTFYRWVQKDVEFKNMANACLGGEDEIKARYNISKDIQNGNVDTSFRYLDKVNHFKNRYDPKYMDDKAKELQKNPITGVFEAPTGVEDISVSLLGEGFEVDESSGLDAIEQVLYREEEKANEVIEELISNE